MLLQAAAARILLRFDARTFFSWNLNAQQHARCMHKTLSSLRKYTVLNNKPDHLNVVSMSVQTPFLCY